MRPGKGTLQPQVRRKAAEVVLEVGRLAAEVLLAASKHGCAYSRFFHQQLMQSNRFSREHVNAAVLSGSARV